MDDTNANIISSTIYDLAVSDYSKNFFPTKKSGERYTLTSDISYDERTVIEMKYNHDEDNFEFVRLRPNKFGKPNALHVFRDVFEDINNPIKLDNLYVLVDLAQMRKYHNIQKESLINKYINSSNSLLDVLDIGIGRFGDATKYKKVRNLVGIEPDEKNIQEIKKRDIRVRYKYEIIHGKGEDNYDNIGKFDIVSMFFSLTFFFQSEELLDKLLQNIKKHINLNGYFIGCVSIIEDLVDKSNDYYEITTVGGPTVGGSISGDPTLEKTVFGRKISVHIKEDDIIFSRQEEYLVDFDTLVNKLKDLGFELIEKVHFQPIKKMNELVNEFIEGNIKFAFRYIGDTKEVQSHYVEKLPKEYRRKIIKNLPELLKSEEKNSKNMLNPNVYEFFTNIYQCPLVRVGVDGKGSCFVDSILRSINKEYVKADSDERKVIVEGIRRNIADNFTLEKYQKSEVSKTIDYDKLIGKIKAYDSWIDDYTRSIFADYFNFNIILLDSDSQRHSTGERYDKNKQCILMYYISNLHFEPIYRLCRGENNKVYIEKIFMYEDDLIKKIIDH